MKKNIVLTGFMGTGKSTVGKIVAARLEFAFVDTDDLIEDEAGCSISEIFQKSGETVFRQLERDMARRLAKRERLVIATGGRFMLDADNAAALEKNGLVFCLVADPEVLLDRLLRGENKRPLLDSPYPEERMMALLAERAEGYGRFLQIATTGKTPDEVADQILQSVAEL